MDKKELAESIQEYFSYWRTPDPQSITIYTGAGGMDLIQESMDNAVGYLRIYIGKKVSRMLRVLKSPIRKSYSGRYYKLIKK